MVVVKRFVLLFIGAFLLGCSSELADSSLEYAELISTFDFETDDQLWDGGISDYPVDYEDNLTYEVRNQLPTDSASVYEGNGLSITAENPHGDLFYFFKKKIGGFKTNTHYKLDFEFLVFSELDSSIEVSNDEDVYLKVGAVNFQPILEKQLKNSLEYVALNVDKGINNDSSGADMVNVGSIKDFIGNQPETISGNTFDIPIEVKSDADGSIWLLIGVDSGIKSNLTFSLAAITIYYSEILG